MLRFLTRGVEHRPDLAREMRRCLEQQRRLADAGLAAEQDERTGHDAAAEDAIELADAGRQPRRIGELNLGVQLRDAAGAKLGVAIDRRRRFRRRGALFDQRVPGAALSALPQPLRRLRAALLTHVDGLRLHCRLVIADC
jgi:hypothetical protein